MTLSPQIFYSPLKNGLETGRNLISILLRQFARGSPPLPQQSGEYKYWAFLSYSHQDNRDVRSQGGSGHVHWADWLHESLETYRVPSQFLRRMTCTHESVPRRFCPVFQDEKELPINANLGESIRIALRESRFLIVICSPRSATSRYVNEEVRYFKELGRHSRIMTLIIDGEPNVRFGNKPGFSADQECFCEALQHPLDEKNEIDKTRTDPQEPIAGDIRIKDAASVREAMSPDLRSHRPAMRRAKLKLLAGMMGVGLDELVQRDRQRRRRQRLMLAASLVGILGLLCTAGVWLTKLQLKTRSLSYVSQAEKVNDEASAQIYYARANFLYPNHEAQANAETYIRALSLPLQVFSHASNSVRTLAFSPDGKILATGGDDHMVRLWNVATGLPLGRPMSNEEEVVRIKFSLDGTKILDETRNGSIRVWDSKTCAPYGKGLIVAGEEIDWDAEEVDAMFSPDCSFYGPQGNYVVRLGQYKEPLIQYFDVRTGARIGTGGGNMPPYRTDYTFSPDGEKLAIADGDRSAHLWDLRKNPAVDQSIPLRRRSAIQTAFSPDGHQLAIRGSNDVEIFNLATGKISGAPIISTNQVAAVFFKPDGKTLLTVDSDGDTQDWDMNTGQPGGPAYLSWGAPADKCVWNSREGFGKTVELSPDGKSIAAIRMTPHGESTAQIMELRRERTLLIKDVKLSSEISDAAFSPDRKTIFTGKGDTSIGIWNADTGQSIGKITGFSSAADCLSVSPSGKFALIGSEDGITCLWDLKGHKQIGRGWSPPDYKGLHSKSVLSVAFTPDESVAITGNGDKTIQFWNVARGSLIADRVLTAESYVYCVAVSPDEKFIASGGGKYMGSGMHPGEIQVWDARTGQMAWRTDVSEQEVHAVAFSPDGNTVIAGSDDGIVHFWESKTGQPIGEPIAIGEHTGESLNSANEIVALAFSPDGKTLSTVTSDGDIRSWTVPWENDKVTASELLLEVQLATHRDVADNGIVRNIPFPEWLALFRKYQSLQLERSKK